MVLAAIAREEGKSLEITSSDMDQSAASGIRDNRAGGGYFN
jgi:hypothetical protein